MHANKAVFTTQLESESVYWIINNNIVISQAYKREDKEKSIKVEHKTGGALIHSSSFSWGAVNWSNLYSSFNLHTENRAYRPWLSEQTEVYLICAFDWAPAVWAPALQTLAFLIPATILSRHYINPNTRWGVIIFISRTNTLSSKNSLFSWLQLLFQSSGVILIDRTST